MLRADMKTMPLPMSGDAFVEAGKGLNQLRHTVVGERAEPGFYSCVLAESICSAAQQSHLIG